MYCPFCGTLRLKALILRKICFHHKRFQVDRWILNVCNNWEWYIWHTYFFFLIPVRNLNCVDIRYCLNKLFLEGPLRVYRIIKSSKLWKSLEFNIKGSPSERTEDPWIWDKVLFPRWVCHNKPNLIAFLVYFDIWQWTWKMNIRHTFFNLAN